jgi:hypothetical protein
MKTRRVAAPFDDVILATPSCEQRLDGPVNIEASRYVSLTANGGDVESNPESTDAK